MGSFYQRQDILAQCRRTEVWNQAVAWFCSFWRLAKDSLVPLLVASCCYSFTQLCPTLCDPMDCSTPGFPVHHKLPELAQTQVSWVGGTSNHLILCRPFLLLLSIFPNIRVFSSESVLPIRWPKYWSFSFNISPSNEYSGLISFRIDWFDLLAVQGTLKSLLQHHSSKASVLQHSASLQSNSHIYTWLLEKP